MLRYWSSKIFKCARTEVTQITKILGSKAESEINSKLKTTTFSLIVDEATDISTQKSLVLVVRYIDKLAVNSL